MKKDKIEKFIKTLKDNNLILFYNHSRGKLKIEYIGPNKQENKKKYLKSMKLYKKAKPMIVKNSGHLKEYFYNEFINKTREVYKFDPRPELKGHNVVKKILKKSYENDKEFYNSLHGLRCVGLIIREKNKKLNFTYDKNSSYFKDKNDFGEKVKKYLDLKTNKEKLVQMVAS